MWMSGIDIFMKLGDDLVSVWVCREVEECKREIVGNGC